MPPLITHTEATPRGSPKSETPMPSPSARVISLDDQTDWDNQSNNVSYFYCLIIFTCDENIEIYPPFADIKLSIAETVMWNNLTLRKGFTISRRSSGRAFTSTYSRVERLWV